VGDVLQDHGLADAVGADEHGVVAGGDEAGSEEVVDGLAVDFLGPGSVEVGHGLEGGYAGVFDAAFKAALVALALLDGEHLAQPRLVGELLPAREEAEEAEALEAGFGLGGREIGHGVGSFFRAS
jgi:hypothetical protein